MTTKKPAKLKGAKKTGPLYTPLESYDPDKHFDIVPPTRGILGSFHPEHAAKDFRFIQQQGKFADACLAMGIDPDETDSGDRLLARLCEEKWPKGFKEKPPKKQTALSAGNKKDLAAFRLYLRLAEPIRRETGRMPEILAVAKAILKGGKDEFSEGVDVSGIFSRNDVQVGSYKRKSVRAIPAPGAGRKPQKFFDGMIAWARGEGAALDYILIEEVDGALAAKGPILARFIPADVLAELVKKADAAPGDAMFFLADPDARRAASLAARTRTKCANDLSLSVTQFPGLMPTTKHGKTVKAVLGKINRGGKLEHWKPLQELKLWGPDILALGRNGALQPLDKLADCDEPLSIVTGERDKSPIAWALYNRLRDLGGNVEHAADLHHEVMADFEAMVCEAEKEQDAAGEYINRAGLVILDASFRDNGQAGKIKSALAEAGLHARIVRATGYMLPKLIGLPKLLDKSLDPHAWARPRPYYLINLRSHVPEALSRSSKAEAAPVERPTSYRARKFAESMARRVELFAAATPQQLVPYTGGGGIFASLGGTFPQDVAPEVATHAAE